MILEIPCGNIESVHAALEGGADRIELCSAMPLGGLTPTVAMLENVSGHSINVFVMIRPREGDFNFSQYEFKTMLRDIELLKAAGANGIVSGILTKGAEIDMERTRELIEASRPLPFTFHRAFDLTADAFRSLDALLELNVNRLLTSGQAPDAWTGRDIISKLVKLSGDKIKIIAGAGVNPGNVAAICEFTGVLEIHLSGRVKKRSEMSVHDSSIVMGKAGQDENDYEITDTRVIKKVREIVDQKLF